VNIMRRQIITVGAWVLFAGLLLYVKDRREKANWKEVTDKIIGVRPRSLGSPFAKRRDLMLDEAPGGYA